MKLIAGKKKKEGEAAREKEDIGGRWSYIRSWEVIGESGMSTEVDDGREQREMGRRRREEVRESDGIKGEARYLPWYWTGKRL
jgi:hypothetical protein